jgi:hypothetical protein
MTTSLTEALSLLDLSPGNVFRTSVNGRDVEVRVLKKAHTDKQAQLDGQQMIDLWLDVPPSSLAKTVTVHLSPPLLPSPYKLDESDLTPE